MKPRTPNARPGAGSALSVGGLRLTVPGADRGAGQRIAVGVARGLAERVPAGLSGHVGRLDITVRPDGTGEQAVTQAVVEALLRVLPRSGG